MWRGLLSLSSTNASLVKKAVLLYSHIIKARLYMIVDYKIGNMIVVKGGDSSEKSVSRCDPTESEANEEAHGPPAESVRL
jgi:hypothetical protein